MKLFVSILMIVFGGGIALQASANTYSFSCITGNIAGDCSIGQAQLSVTVTDQGYDGTNNTVRFTFNNTGNDDSSIADVHFDDGSLLGIASLIDRDDGVGGDLGVDFSQGGSPPILPGRNNVTPAFETTAGFLADSDSPVQSNGVNPGEYLGIIFTLQGTQDFADVLAELADGRLRIGIHVQGFETGGSESFVNDVPVPAAAWLFGSGLIALAGVARRKKSVA